MRVTYASAARRDLDAIIDYISLEDRAAAERVFYAISDSVSRLGDYPNMGHVGRVPDTRELSVTGLPYIVVYEVSAEAVTVLAVFHGARDLARAMAERSKGMPDT
ncbi:type II toxin-antitoxin system RelE/ParE family toxin [Qipengyuania sp. XHP0207]|uniref:type II toxin-antitoxin system RelE/ParE family toxin n=1 Tax=Qipengyuania sp. XHP0207 TaxID=3038078 RepID=UPI00241CCBB1|nr:type II toxin-antitoxin system RelE/ParE family toxin [Qipengyuania sp. XHP0207]MDG5749160.1 type II toxin-antitoxin system RelE/ParE family toxin [Qipengyuania sp. XHP0207]